MLTMRGGRSYLGKDLINAAEKTILSVVKEGKKIIKVLPDAFLSVARDFAGYILVSVPRVMKIDGRSEFSGTIENIRFIGKDDFDMRFSKNYNIWGKEGVLVSLVVVKGVVVRVDWWEKGVCLPYENFISEDKRDVAISKRLEEFHLGYLLINDVSGFDTIQIVPPDSVKTKLNVEYNCKTSTVALENQGEQTGEPKKLDAEVIVSDGIWDDRVLLCEGYLLQKQYSLALVLVQDLIGNPGDLGRVKVATLRRIER